MKAYSSVENERRSLGLKMSTDKTKYMELFVLEACQRVQDITIGLNKFEAVESFVYLGSAVNKSNNLSEEISRKIMASMRIPCQYLTFWFKTVIEAIMIKLYNTFIRPILCFGAKYGNGPQLIATNQKYLKEKW